MHLSELRVRNFRNFKSAKFKFNEGVNTLIGENGSGKTNAFQALRLILDDNLPRNASRLNENDFSRFINNNWQHDSWKGHWIAIGLEFEPLNEDFSESLESLVYHGLENNGKKASFTMIFRPNKKKREELFNAAPHDIAEVVSNITIEDYVIENFGKTQIDFTNDQEYADLVGNPENHIFTDPNSENQKKLGTRVPGIFDIHREFNFSFIHATRDVMKEFKWNPRNPLLNLLSSESESLNDFEIIVEQAKKINSLISQSNDVNELKTSIEKTYNKTVGKTYSPSRIDIFSELPEDEESLFKNLTLYMGESFSGYGRPLNELSLGEANLIYISLKLLEFEISSTKNSVKNFLIIEEPESHIHTHIQRTLFNKVLFKNTQIIYSTHSTQVSAVSNIRNMNIIVMSDGQWKVAQPSSGLNENEIESTSRYLDAIRSDILFARGVVLVEGDAEEILIPSLIKVLFGIELDELGVVVVNVGSTGFEHLARLFHEDRIVKKCSILTDSDRSYSISPLPDSVGTSAIPFVFPKNQLIVPDLYKKLIPQLEHQLASAKAGIGRKAKLNSNFATSNCIKIYYAKHTFEIDLAIDSTTNNRFFSELVDSVYKQEKKKERLKELFASELNYDIASAAIEMAEYSKKGWFALLISSKITKENITIPNYILESITHTADFSSPEILENIFDYLGEDFLVNDTNWYEVAKNKNDYITEWGMLSSYITNINLVNLLKLIGEPND